MLMTKRKQVQYFTQGKILNKDDNFGSFCLHLVLQIDRLYQWKPMPHTDIVNAIKKQSPNTKSEFDTRTSEVIVQMAEQVSV